MIRLVTKSTGEGKTTELISLANNTLSTTKGHIVYIDLDSSHMYDLKHEIRYINISEFPIDNYREFFGFMCGILSEDNDINEIYVDGLLKQAHIDDIGDSDELVIKLKILSEKFDVRFIFSVNCVECKLPDFLKEFMMTA